MASESGAHKDYPYDPAHHQPGTHGYANECTVRNCPERPVVSRQWLPAESPTWWAAYCERHAEEKLTERRKR